MGTVERAFQLAPECKTMDELRAKLSREHFGSIDAHLQGSLRRDLRKLLNSEAARSPAP
jgi:predicted component of type VI protein secretion system